MRLLHQGRRLNGRLPGDQTGLSTVATLSVIVAALALLIVGYYVVPDLLPKSGGEKYEADRKSLQTAVLAFHTGYLATSPRAPDRGATADTRAGNYPTLAKPKKGTANAVKEEDAGSEPLTTLSLPQSNPTGSKGQSGTPNWEDADGDRKRTPGDELLYYDAADPAPTTDHWNTTTVTLDDTSYVVDSRDWFIDVDDLTEDDYLRGKLESASPDNSPTGTGSYSWYVDANGKVRSMLYSSPTSDTDGYQGVYP